MSEATVDRPRAGSLPGERLLPRGGRVLIIRLSALGDVLFALETVAALRRDRPDVAIDFLVEDRFANLLDGHPQIDRVLVYPRRRRLRIPGSLVALRRTRYDVALDLHGIQKSAMHMIACRARTKVGPAAPASREGASVSYNLTVPMPTPPPHRAAVGHMLLAAIGLSGAPCAPTVVAADPPAELLADLPRPRVLLHPGTSAFAAFKRWPGDRFAELARRLERRGVAVVIGFGPGERELAEPALAAAPHSRAADGAQLGLAGLAGVMQQCDVVVAADTGPLHLGAAAGARCVAIFGPKDPDRYGPRGHGDVRHELVFHDVPCRPCKRRSCASPQCVLGIDVDTVERAVLRQLDRPEEPTP
ncbi:MAG: glycosyltransferase family 9 protein [Planctomycetes bacterium]|nr:glycosyltransferase family 9 protein [Planctomycetota bacterium]